MGIYFNQEELLAKKSNKGYVIHKFGKLKVSKLLNLQISDSDIVTLSCGGNFTLSGQSEEQTVISALVNLKLVKSNRVTKLDVQFRYGDCNESGRNIEYLRSEMEEVGNNSIKKQCVVQVDSKIEILINAITENGEMFEPDPNSFELCIKHCSFETPDGDVNEPFLSYSYEFCGRNVDSTNLFTKMIEPVQANDGFVYFKHEQYIVDGCTTCPAFQVGLYELTVSYRELRESDSLSRQGGKKVLINKLNFQILMLFIR